MSELNKAELRRIAEACEKHGRNWYAPRQISAFPEFQEDQDFVLAVSPSVLLALLDESDQRGEEIDRLRGRFAYWKQRAKSAEGHLLASDRQKACEALNELKEKSGGGVTVLGVVGLVLSVIGDRRRNRLPHDSRPGHVWCACGDGYPADSYGAGFMDANNGICENCQAVACASRDTEEAAEEGGPNG